MSLVLVYAGTPTIFANFRTFIRLYFIIFIATSQPYIAALRRTPMSLYTTPTLHHILRCIALRLAPSHRHRLVSLHVTCQVLRPSRAARSTTPKNARDYATGPDRFQGFPTQPSAYVRSRRTRVRSRPLAPLRSSAFHRRRDILTVSLSLGMFVSDHIW